jgi:hypothetical protein
MSLSFPFGSAVSAPHVQVLYEAAAGRPTTSSVALASEAFECASDSIDRTEGSCGGVQVPAIDRTYYVRVFHFGWPVIEPWDA